MADHNTLKHVFTSAVADDADASLVRPSNWNKEHIFNGGVNGQGLIYDSTQTDHVIFDSYPYIDISSPAYAALDFSSALVTALAALPSTGGVIHCERRNTPQTIAAPITISKSVRIFLPAVDITYAGSSTAFLIAADGVELIGFGRNTKFLLTNSGTTAFLRNSSPGTVLRNLRAENFKITGPGSGVVGSVGFYLSTFYWSIIESVEVQSCENGIVFDSVGGQGYFNQLRNVSPQQCGTGVFFTNEANTQQIYGGRFQGNSTAINVSSAQNIRIDAVSFEGNSTYAILLGTASTQCYITGCRFENSVAGGLAVYCTGNAFRSILEGNYYSTLNDIVQDASTTQSLDNKDSYATTVTGGGAAQGRIGVRGRYSSRNLVPNGYMRFNLGNGAIASGWSELRANAENYTWSVNTTGGPDGGPYQRYQNIGPDYHLQGAVRCQFPVKIGTRYCLAISLLSNSVSQQFVRLGTSASETAYNTITNPYSDSNWHTFYSSFLATTAIAQVTIYYPNEVAFDGGHAMVSCTPGMLPPDFDERRVEVFTHTIDLPSCTANTTTETTVTNMIGLLTTDTVILQPNSGSFNAGLVISHCRVATDGQLTIRIGNLTAGAIDPASQDFRVTVIRND